MNVVREVISSPKLASKLKSTAVEGLDDANDTNEFCSLKDDQTANHFVSG